MPTTRGAAVFAAGVTMWLAGRLLGSAALDVVGFGLMAAPFLAAAFARWRRQQVEVQRRLSDVRVRPGTRVAVKLELENRGPAPTPVLLLEDGLPPAMGRPARLVVSGIPARGRQEVAYTLVPHARGRYVLGPLTADLADPFDLVRQRLELHDRDELLVTPEIEDLLGGSDVPNGPSFGAQRARALFRTGEEFYTMRQYQEGDDLRRLHWPSVARTGELMIRQDESSRRSSGLVFLDNRVSALGEVRRPSFERAVSVAASIAVLLSRGGFSLRLATADSPASALSEEALLDVLAGIGHATTRSIANSLTHLKSGAAGDTTLAFVSGPPDPNELGALIRAGGGYGPKLAVLVQPVDPETLAPDRRAEVQGRATKARLAFARAGWDCIVLPPTMRLLERWHTPRERQPALSG